MQNLYAACCFSSACGINAARNRICRRDEGKISGTFTAWSSLVVVVVVVVVTDKLPITFDVLASAVGTSTGTELTNQAEIIIVAT
jgi:hypothetical protein